MIKTYISKELETKRLILKHGTEDDYVKIFEYNLTKLNNVNGVFCYEKNSSKEIRSWFKPNMNEYYKELEEKHTFNWAIYLKQTSIPIGDIMVDRENLENLEAEFSVNLHPTYWGNGYMKEAIESVINYLFTIGYKRLIYGYYEGNIKSKKLAQKMNFKLYKVEKSDIVDNNNEPLNKYYYVIVND